MDMRIRIQLCGMETSRTLGPINGKTNFRTAMKSALTELPRIFFPLFCLCEPRRTGIPAPRRLSCMRAHVYVYLYICVRLYTFFLSLRPAWSRFSARQYAPPTVRSFR